MKSKVINVLFVLVALSLNGCTKKVLMKHAESEAVKVCENDFYRQFHALVLEEEKKELENIKTLSECREFLDKFWRIRDTNPTTPQNEYKEEKEKLASDIKNETLFKHPETTGFLFKSSGDFAGDPAKVYMLHGMPAFAEILQNGQRYVNLMLWIYLDTEGRHKYRFLFYHKGGIGNFVLLRPDFDIFYGLNEINKNPTITHPLDVYDELDREGNRIVLYSMVYFSDDSTININEALDPPKPASEIAKELAPKIIEDAPEKEILISNGFESLVPANFSYEVDNESLVVKIMIKHENLDWVFENNELTAELYVKITVWGENNKFEAERNLGIISTEIKIKEKRSTFIFESEPIELHEQPQKLSVYIKNNNKYNAWDEEIKR